MSARVPGLAAIVLATAVVSGCGRADPGSGRSDLRPLPSGPALQAALDVARTLSGGTGVSAAVVVEGEGHWAGASGRSGSETALHADMLFDVGSVGKNLVAALVLQLAEEGRLLVLSTFAAWREGRLPFAVRVHLLLVVIAGVATVVYWQRLGLLLP